MRDGYVMKSSEAPAAEMEQINRYTRREYKSDEVYTFSLVLCDNEVDRDFERFSIDALKKLKELFLGKTCILDHERKSVNQTARIYSTAVECEHGRVTQCGEAYTRLTAKAYLPRTAKNAETIELIESGILKEVSVSCAVKHSVCSICGKEHCTHQKDREYGGKLCCRVLDEPNDAYECSFVAVPAQREAGVRKGWRDSDGSDCLKKIKESFCQAVRLSADEAEALRESIAQLEEKAAWGEKYRDSLKESILKYGGFTTPELPRAVLMAAMENLSLSQLCEMGKAYEEMAQRTMPLRPQLAPEPKEKQKTSNGAYRI